MAGRQEFDAYVICTTPRSGSTLLCGLLAATGLAGAPDSHFHRPSVSDWLRDHGLRPEDHSGETAAISAAFDAALSAGRGAGSIFGLRLQRNGFEFFLAKLRALHPDPTSDAARFDAAFGRTLFIRLTRGDKVAQAVSYVRAEQSGLWHAAPDGAEIERLSAPQPLRYDFGRIAAQVAAREAEERAWDRWFEREGVSPLRLSYDEVSADGPAAVGRVLRRLGLDPDAANAIAPPVAKLADEVNLRWIEAFRKDARVRPFRTPPAAPPAPSCRGRR